MSIEELIKLVGAVFVSSGIWTGFTAWVAKRRTDGNSERLLLMGLAYDRINYLGINYIERGWISSDEYEDYFKYLFTPYKNLGGNGSAERIMKEVQDLPLSPPGKAVEARISRAKETREHNGE